MLYMYIENGATYLSRMLIEGSHARSVFGHGGDVTGGGVWFRRRDIVVIFRKWF